MKLTLPFTKSKAKADPRSLTQRVRIFAKSAGLSPYLSFAELRSAMGHFNRYPARRLHPTVTTRHKNFWNKKRTGAKRYGRNEVLFTNHEGGTWQKYPWSTLPELGKLTSLAAARGDANEIMYTEPNRKFAIRIHSLLIYGKRWDCVSGFGTPVQEGE